ASASGARASQSSDSSCPGSRGSAVIARRIAWMRADFTFEMPPGRIASSTCATGASRTARQEKKRPRRRRNATSRLRSLVDCDSTVSTSSAIGCPWGRICGVPYTARRRSRMRSTRARLGRRHALDRAPATDARERARAARSGPRRRLAAPAASYPQAADADMLARVPELSDHSAELEGLPLFWRRAPVPDAAGTAQPLYLHGVPDSSDQWADFLQRSGGVAP